MFEKIPVNADHIIAVRAAGVLTDADYQDFLPELEQLIEREGPISAYVDMQDFKRWEAKAAWDDLKFGIAHDIDFDRIAVVGNSKWQQWMVKVSNIFFTADMRYFPVEEKQEAMDWLQEGREDEAAREEEKPFRPYSHILLATDFSPHAELAARRALEMVDKYGAKLSIVHVLDNMILYDGFIEPVVIDQVSLYQELETSSRQLLDKLVDRMGVQDRAEVHLLGGSPRDELLRFAGEKEVDLIVLGSHGRRGLDRLLGSVAAGITNRADCDVLAVHLKQT
ncbi:MAG: universal stress protein [Desulfobulbaceae bacterium]|nr:universal stress protein [Desulfobulbaceae bacterium]